MRQTTMTTNSRLRLVHPDPEAGKPSMLGTSMEFSPYIEFSRKHWAKLRAATPLTLNEQDLEALHGIIEFVSLEEVSEIYLPLSRLLNLYVAAAQDLYRVTDTFLGSPAAKVPFVIAIAGSVAVGKSTTARILRALLARWPNTPRVDLVTTDGFLYPNAVLEERGLMRRKGFPESYDTRRLVQFLADIKSGHKRVEAPVYSHLVYDILPDRHQIVRNPDILILEGLNVLQRASSYPQGMPKLYLSDLFDFSIYVDAAEADLENWYLERFLQLRQTAFKDPEAYFHNYAAMPETDATTLARRIWAEINAVNLRDNIYPTRERAHLILGKGADHRVTRVQLRKI